MDHLDVSDENTLNEKQRKLKIIQRWNSLVKGKEYRNINDLLTEINNDSNDSLDILSGFDLWRSNPLYNRVRTRDMREWQTTVYEDASWGGGVHIGLPGALVSIFNALIVEGQSIFPHKSVLDTWVNPGGLLREMERNLEVNTTECLVPNDASKSFCKFLSLADQSRKYGTQLSYDFINIDPDEIVSDPPEEYDVVLSQPRLDNRKLKVRFDNGVEITDSKTSLHFLLSALHQNNKGIGFYVLPDSFFNPKSNNVRGNLSKFGLYIDAVFHISSGTFHPEHSLAANLVIVKSGIPTEKLFVGEAVQLSEESPLSGIEEIEPNVGLAKLYWEGEWRNLTQNSLENPVFGTATETSTFDGFQALKKNFELVTLFESIKFPIQRLDEISKVHAIKKEDVDHFFQTDDHSHMNLYLTRLHRSKSKNIATSLEEVLLECEMDPEKVCKYWIRIEIDPEKVTKDALSYYLKSDLGIKAFKAQLTGSSFMPRASIKNIENLRVCIPHTLEEQRRYVSARNDLHKYKNKISMLVEDLEKNPDSHDQILEVLSEFDNHNKETHWSDSLPSPLSTILWRYESYSDSKIKEKVSSLEDFFEALLMFLTCIVIGAVKNDPDFQEMHFDKWNKKIREQLNVHPLKKVSRAQMSIIHEISSKKIRKDLDNLDPGKGLTREFWQTKFACQDLKLLREIVGKPVINLVAKANELRNDAHHEGLITVDLLQERISSYRLLLDEVQSIFGRRWESYPLIRPTASHNKKGKWKVEALKLIGPRSPFKEEEYELTEGLDEEKLHLINPVLGYSCTLPLLLRIGDTPITKDTNFYFYNKRENDEMKYISFHHEVKPIQHWNLEDCGILNDFLDIQDNN